MGLDFNISEAHWTYGGFNRFRIKLAKEIGINLDNMQGFNGSLSWKNIKDPIVNLLNHSDCAGVISIEDCHIIGKRLKELVKNWNEEDSLTALKLAKDMENAVEELEFM